MRRSEVAALRWADVADAGDADGILVTIRRSKTNQEGETTDVRFVKNGVARAIRTLRAVTSQAPADRVVPLSAQMIGLRFAAAATAAGLDRRVTAHSGRVGLASELTSRRGVDDRRDARRQLEDLENGGPLRRRCDRRTRRRGPLSVDCPRISYLRPGGDYVGAPPEQEP